MTPLRPSPRPRALLATWAVLAALAVPAAAQYYTQFGKNKVQFKDFKWQIYHAPHFDVYYYTEEEGLLQKVVSYAESAYDQLSQEFNHKIQEPTALIFYETHADFEQNNVIQNFIPEGTGAFASSVRNRMFLPTDLPDHELMGLIVHELTHIFEYHILFGGNLGRGVAANVPLWLMEGLAEYMRGEESAREKMFVRDAVVNDRIPQVTQGDIPGFFAYRYGYAVFEFMEERWGREGVQDFIFELRNTLGGRVGKALQRAFQIEPEDFDADFRRWLRRKYLAELLETGEPGDFGRPFRAEANRTSQEVSPTASPSGDLVAAFTTIKGDVDVVLFDTKRRTLLRNLTKGYSGDYQYYLAQELTLGRKMGRDIDFSPDGNTIAFFARKDRGRHLVLIDALKGKIVDSIPLETSQQFSPAWHPDGRRIAFSGYRGGRFDIFELDLDSRQVRALTDDDVFDASPTYAPDGRALVMSSVVGGYAKLFRIDLDDPAGGRTPLREGVRSKDNETDAVFSRDGKRLYYTSDASGANNIYSLDLESGVVRQHTNSVTGCFQPTVLTAPDGRDRLVFTAYWKGRFQLYRLDIDEPITEPVVVTEQQMEKSVTLALDQLPRFEPSIEVTLDDANKEKYGGKKFYLENVVGGTIGVSDDQTFIAQIAFLFSDFLGDRKILAAFQSIESFQNFDVLYIDQSDRLQWILHLFDNRDFFVTQDRRTGEINRTSLLKQTGVIASLVYPFNVNHRAELGAGYVLRDIDFQTFLRDPDGNLIFDENGLPIPIVTPRDDDFPLVQGALIGDTAVFASWGGVSGRRWRLFGSYAPDLDDSGTLTSTYSLDVRQYVTLTRRSNVALRLYGAMSDGNFPNPIYIGGLDTIRGFEFRSLVGDRAFYGNVEVRFPLLDVLATPLVAFQGIRGVIFLDVGGAWFDGIQSFRAWNSDLNALQDAVSSYGFGLTVRFFGLDLNWDFAKRWDFDSSASGFDTSFWIGRRF